MNKALPFIFSLFALNALGQDLPSSISMKDISGGTFIMGNNSLMGSPSQQAAAPEHEVTLSSYSMSEAEITNAQYVEFLNAAYADGLLEIVTGTSLPDQGKRLIQGTASSGYSGKVLYSLDGTRVLKDHDNADGDNNEFTGEVEPENPLNISYIDFNTSTNLFYIKNPHDTSDFHWRNICDYRDYATTPGQTTGPVLNDFDDWAGTGQNLSDELEGWTAQNPAAASKLPDLAEVSSWPVTFIRWWGAKAFADYYNVNLPTEAQWEYAAQGGQSFVWATHNGTDTDDANWNTLGLGTVAVGHVRPAVSGMANPFGLYNLGGNCWEWLADHYLAPYDTASVTDPVVEVPGSTTRCWRCGAWNYHEATLQSSIRFSDDENRGNDHFGFRVAGVHSSLGMGENGAPFDFAIYPNPTNHVLHIDMHEAGVKELSIHSIDGKVIYRAKVSDKATLDVSHWQKGIYLVKSQNRTKKIVLH